MFSMESGVTVVHTVADFCSRAVVHGEQDVHLFVFCIQAPRPPIMVALEPEVAVPESSISRIRLLWKAVPMELACIPSERI